MKISENSNGRIIEKWLKFPSSHSDQRNRLMNFSPALFRRFKDLEPMLSQLVLRFHVNAKESEQCSQNSTLVEQTVA